MGLFNEDGIFTTELEGMQKIAADFFINLFTADTGNIDIVPCARGFPEVDEGKLSRIGREVPSEDVHAALLSIGRLKAPGWDGFPAGFFQDQWRICGPDICFTVQHAFSQCSIPDGLNHTLIVLVPKISAPQHMKFFRPISLCCTAYKIISKIIVSRLRPFLSQWISPNQVSFVPGRQISDNIMIGQEILHKFKTTSGKKGFLAWKVDLAKAYDRLSWDFISQVLKEVKIPNNLAKLIMSCVSTTSFQVLLNGELSNKFVGTRGIRQGDPLSPYLFVLCMEKLAHLIQHVVATERWKPVKATRFGPYISHLFFADDLILFAEASSDQAHILRKVMDDFCSISGQAVSFEKSSILCSPNVNAGLAKSISDIIGSPLTDNLGNYLGMPLIHSSINKNSYAFLVDKVNSRLASWKSKTLNMAGRLTLIQSVNSAIPNYAMQTAKLPISICDKLDGLNRNFLWGSSVDRKKVHLVNWGAVCRPKALGGLGVKRTRDMNQAMLAKASWRMLQQDEGLWCKIYKQKYLVQSSLTQYYKKPASCSSTWSSVSYGAELLRRGLKWRIGNGKGVKFWKDNWSDFGELADHATCSPADLNATVCEFWDVHGWDVAKLTSVLPMDIVQCVCAVPIGKEDMEDRMIWGPASNGDFSVKSAYMLHFAEDSLSCAPWKLIWKLDIPPKLKIFIWTVVSGKILTNVQRTVRHFSMDPSCSHCPDQPENLLHLFRDCAKARQVWDAFNIPISMKNTFVLNWKDWLLANLLQDRRNFLNIPWNAFFSFLVWHIWKWRCKCIFDNNFRYPHEAKRIICSYMEDWRRANVKERSSRDGEEVGLSWHRPGPGVIKLNIDGARNSGGAIGAGGVMRDHEGEWKGGFMASLGVGEVLQAEAWALLHGLQMAAEKDATRIEIESDSAVLVGMLQKGWLEVHPLGTLLLSCSRIMKSFLSCSLRHVHREENNVADVLAKASLGGQLGCLVLCDAPLMVMNELIEDADGKSSLRHIHSIMQFSDNCNMFWNTVDS